eukprot:jgi/Pico_ML_1/52364/g3076.t1
MKHTLTGRTEKTFMKLIVDAASQKVVGVHMAGADVAEMMQVVWMLESVQQPGECNRGSYEDQQQGVRLDLEGGHLVAASAFLGHATKERVEQEHHQLTHKLQADGLALACHDAQEKYHVAQYGPLFSLQPRKNELWVRVQL